MVGSHSYAFIIILRSYCTYVTMEKVWVADVCGLTSRGNSNLRWNGNAKFPKRKVDCRPEHAFDIPDFNEIRYVKRKKKDLNNVSLTLISRLVNEFNHYLACTDDQLLAMAVNPLTVQLGFDEIAMLVRVLGNAKDVDVSKFRHDWKQKAQDLLIQEIKDKYVSPFDASASASAIDPPSQQESLNASASDDDSDDETPIVKARRAMANHRRILAGQKNTSRADKIVDEVKRWFELSNNWHNYLKGREVDDDILKEIGEDKDHWRMAFTTIAENFQVMDWWHYQGREHFPYVYMVACAHLPLPESNGHQERTFSACTWFDSKLRKKTSDTTFEMRALIYKNKKFLDEFRSEVTKEMKETASTVARGMLMEALAQDDPSQLTDDDAFELESSDDEDDICQNLLGDAANEEE